LSGQVASTAVGTDAEEDAKQQRQRVEDVDDTRHVRDGKQRRAGDHHLYWPVAQNHHVYITPAAVSQDQYQDTMQHSALGDCVYVCVSRSVVEW